MITINHYNTQSDKNRIAIVTIRCNDKSDKILSVKSSMNEFINHMLFKLSPGHTATGPLPFLTHGNRVYRQIYRSKEMRPIRSEFKDIIGKFMIDLGPISKEDHDFALKSYIAYESNLKAIKRNTVVDSSKKNTQQSDSFKKEKKMTNDNTSQCDRKIDAVIMDTPKIKPKNIKKERTMKLVFFIHIMVSIYVKLKKRLNITRKKILNDKKRKEEIYKIECPTMQDTKGFSQKRAIMDANKKYEFMTNIKYHQILDNCVIAHEENILIDKSLNTVSNLTRHEIIAKLDVLKTHPIKDLSTRFIYYRRKLITILWTPYSGDNRNILLKLDENVYFENPPTRFSNWLTILKFHMERQELDGLPAINVPIDGWTRSTDGLHNVYGELVYTNYSSLINVQLF